MTKEFYRNLFTNQSLYKLTGGIKMKILALLGSPRKKGNTSILLDQYLKGIKEANKNIEITKIYLHEKNIRNCTSCNFCHNIDIGQCFIKDDMQELYIKFKEADMIIFATPIYWWNISAQLKSFIDRIYALDVEQGYFTNKKVSLLMTYGGNLPNKGPEIVRISFEEICKYTDMNLIDVYGVCTDEYLQVTENPKALQDVYDMGLKIS